METKDVKKSSQDKSEATKQDSAGFAEVIKSDYPEMAELEAQVAEEDKSEESQSEANKNSAEEDQSDKSDNEGTPEETKVEPEAIDPAILEDIFGKKEVSEEKSEQTVEEKLKELERKNEKLYKKLMEKEEMSNNPPPPMTPEETKTVIEKAFPNIGFDLAQDLFKFNQSYYQDVVLPEWEKRQSNRIRQSEYKDKIKEHKYYKYVVDDIEKLVKEDPKISKLPDDLKYETALERALVKKLPELVKLTAKKASEQAKSGKKLILKDKPATDSKANQQPKLDINLTKDDIYWQKRMGLTDGDLRKYSGDRTVIED